MGKYQKNIEAARRITVMQYLETYHPGELVRKTDREYCTRTHDSLIITPANGFAKLVALQLYRRAWLVAVGRGTVIHLAHRKIAAGPHQLRNANGTLADPAPKLVPSVKGHHGSRLRAGFQHQCGIAGGDPAAQPAAPQQVGGQMRAVLQNLLQRLLLVGQHGIAVVLLFGFPILNVHTLIHLAFLLSGRIDRAFRTAGCCLAQLCRHRLERGAGVNILHRLPARQHRIGRLAAGFCVFSVSRNLLGYGISKLLINAVELGYIFCLKHNVDFLALCALVLNGRKQHTVLFTALLNDPLSLRWCSSTPKFLLAVLVLYPLGVYCYLLDQADRRPGEEHGSAHWGNASELNERYRNRKDPWQEIILSQNIRLSNDSYQHQRNLHVVVIGGSGSGKTRFFVKPNALQCSGSYFFLDPKGELTYSLGGAMEENGVTVTVIDFVHFRGHYNPVAYLKTDEDAMKLAYALVFNTKKNPAASGGENEFWDKSAVMFLASLILYILYESPLYERNLNTMMDMILECKVSEDSYDENRMDILFGELEQRDPHHPAVLQYRSFKLGSAKTLSSIMVTAVSNLHMLQSAAFAEMIATDEMFLPKLGVEKRAIFCVIPDNDDTFNFMVSILYTQLFDQLFRLADSTPEFHGTLPVHVRLMMDEFANVATPENFVKILAVARSRNISCDIILQNISQIKSKYKDDWETIIGNCDSLVYLGGNDYSTFEYISKLLGKQTIRTKGQSIGKGSHGSSSDSYQVTGRELMTPDEVRRMKRSDCLVMISGEAPVRDKKYNLFDHPNLKYTPDYRSPRGLLHRAATPIPAPEGYTMPPDYMAQAGTVSLAYVAELTCPEITEDLYDELQEWEESLL